jgi:hypothetical protein
MFSPVVLHEGLSCSQTIYLKLFYLLIFVVEFFVHFSVKEVVFEKNICLYYSFSQED